MLDSFYGGRPGAFFKLSGSFRYIYNTSYEVSSAFIVPGVAPYNEGWLVEESGDPAETQIGSNNTLTHIYMVATPGSYKNRFFRFTGSQSDDTNVDISEEDVDTPEDTSDTETSETTNSYVEVFDVGMLQAFQQKQYFTGINFGEYCIIDETNLIKNTTGGQRQTLSPDHGKVFYRDYDYDNDQRLIYIDRTINGASIDPQLAYGATYIGNFTGPTGRDIEDMRIVLGEDDAYYVQVKYNDNLGWQTLQDPLTGLGRYIQAGTMTYVDTDYISTPAEKGVWFKVEDNAYITKNPNNISINSSYTQGEVVVLYTLNMLVLPSNRNLEIDWEGSLDGKNFHSILQEAPFAMNNATLGKAVLIVSRIGDDLASEKNLYDGLKFRCKITLSDENFVPVYPTIYSKPATLYYS